MFCFTKEINYTYDVFGRRIGKSIDDDGAGPNAAEEIQYIYDGFRSDRGNAGDHIILAFDGDDDLTNRYLHGPDVDQVLADEQVPAGDLFWMLADNQGSVRDIVDNDGTVKNHIKYDSFGNITSESDDTVDVIFGYTGRERDVESDLQYNRTRYYDAVTGRWISEDPIGFAAGDTNLNRYVGNGATNFVDPSGLYTIKIQRRTLIRLKDEGIRRGATEAYFDELKKVVKNFNRNSRDKKIVRVIMFQGTSPKGPPKNMRQWTAEQFDSIGSRVLQLHANSRDYGYFEMFGVVEWTDIIEVKAASDEEGKVIEDLVHMGLDIGGIFEPTPFCDGASAYLSLTKGDWAGFLTSAVSIVPYIGDTAKLARLPHYGKTIKRAIGLLAKAGKDSKIAKKLTPVLTELRGLIARGAKSDCLPASVKKQLDEMGKELDKFLACFVKGTPVLVQQQTRASAATVQILAALGALGMVGLEHVRQGRRRKKHTEQRSYGVGGRRLNSTSQAVKPGIEDAERLLTISCGERSHVARSAMASSAIGGGLCASDSRENRSNDAVEDRQRKQANSPETRTVGWHAITTSWARRIAMGMCILVAVVFGGWALWTSIAGEPGLSSYSLKSIEEIRVGDRVLADDPTVEVSEESNVDPATWRRLTLRAELNWQDGTIDDVNVETLQPTKWISAHQAYVGKMVPLPLDLAEMGLPADLKARVIANNPCPRIKDGPGRVVLTTINHLNADVVEMTVRDDRGRKDTFRPTGFHRFYSIDRSDWFHAHQLRNGECIGGHTGDLTVLSIKQVPGTHRVYNMTVEGEHVYFVSALGVLAHNIRCFKGNVRGSYWDSGGAVFPTSVTTKRGIRVRGKGRGGRTKWESGFDNDQLKAEQVKWMKRRYEELVTSGELTPTLARQVMEGQIAHQGRSASSPFLRRHLDDIFGK